MKKNIIFFFFIICLVSVKLYAQDYIRYNCYLTRTRLIPLEKFADSLIKKKILQEKISLYDSAFSCVNYGFIDDYLSAVWISLKLNNYDGTKLYLKKAIERGFTFNQLKQEIKYRQCFFLKTQQYKELKKDYRKIRHSYKKTINKKSKRKIIRILIRDQVYRMFFYKYFHKRQTKLDSINAVKLYKIIQTLGGRFPSINEVGEQNFNLLQPVLLHVNTQDAINFANILLKMYKKGESNDIEFIFDMMDQRSTREGYIFNPESVNKKRR